VNGFEITLFIFSFSGILFEHKGSSVGVIASGPKTMRHEVAAVCYSAENLHFESISFSW